MNSPFLTLSKPLTTLPFLSPPRRHLILRRNTTTDSNNDTSSPPPQPPETANFRFKRGSRKRSKEKQQNDESSNNNGFSKKDQNGPKEWENMTLTEKAIELYVGEKGLLFWLNKFAYASIYVIIGAWILFRFVGPALNLYQLDSGPLSPSALLKG